MKLLKFISFFLSIIIFSSCSDESAISAMEDNIRDARREACDSYFQDHRSSSSSYMSEADKCYYGTSTKSDSYCCSNYGYRCYYVSSSSYMSEADKCYYGTSTKGSTYCCNNYGYQCAYAYSSSSYRYSSSSYRYSSSSVKTEVTAAHITKSKTMMFKLTSYKQKSADWDGISAGGSYSDGDPTISFNIYFIASGGQSTTKSTGTLISLQDQGSWSGTKTTTLEVPVGTQDIKICPYVVDKDVLDNDNKSSGYCYTRTNIGYLANNTTVEQDDYNSTNYNLEWEWYLY